MYSNRNIPFNLEAITFASNVFPKGILPASRWDGHGHGLKSFSIIALQCCTLGRFGISSRG